MSAGRGPSASCGGWKTERRIVVPVAAELWL